MALPDFVVIGAPEAGTSSLHAALTRHLGLAMSPVAEPGYFLTSGRPRDDASPPGHGGGASSGGPVGPAGHPGLGGSASPTGLSGPGGSGDLAGTGGSRAAGGAGLTSENYIWCLSDYETLFRGGDGRRPRGESTPYYLAEFSAQRRMHELLPYLRMIAVLRDPVERAYANWLAHRRTGLEPLPTLIEALDAEEERCAAGWSRRWRYAELGRYGVQLRRLYTLFPPSQVLLVRYRDLVLEPAAVLRRVCGFVGAVDPAAGFGCDSRIFAPATIDPGTTRVVREAVPAAVDPMDAVLAELRRSLRPGPPPPPGLREQVLDRFRDDIALLGQLTGSSFAEWLDRGDLPLTAGR
ncbi:MULTISPECIES: sulfotransferase [unclassified Parafrankia]|uniref:sulfotransferase family protein n=1 Tax=unclassified Parafrankia TaxID=2994368 RepID=UPI000DA571B9|nr:MULTISPECIES: sulfotransferase [unclassified Parafrankia]TCJ35479.1 sulfotransferase [Parafrankia sp. BMG5.11]CAI7980176.1 Sulfotransferase [Frankia sp. Hr75.2]SQD98299.1 Sulfotransferase [Parafrankia sp. Ea1.12]